MIEVQGFSLTGIIVKCPLKYCDMYGAFSTRVFISNFLFFVQRQFREDELYKSSITKLLSCCSVTMFVWMRYEQCIVAGSLMSGVAGIHLKCFYSYIP